LKLIFSLSAIVILGLVGTGSAAEAHAASKDPSEGDKAVPTVPARQPETADIFSLLEEGGADQREGLAECSFDFEPSGSTWTKGVDEKKVFFATLKAGPFRLGIGKGGQIYSLRGPFGESIPPQRANAPWIDEVWHLVVTNNELVTPVHKFQNENLKTNWNAGMPVQYFIHQAGTYLEGLTGNEHTGAPKEPFYSPMVANRWDEKKRTLYLANWAQQARSPNVWKSGALVQTAYRDLGDGVIEVSQVLSNFGTENLTYLNAPWGGVRHSSLPQTILSKPGGWKKVQGTWGWSGIPSALFKDTDGWIGWTVDPQKIESPTLALVFGRGAEGSRPWIKSHHKILFGTAGDVSTRNYEVVETSCNVDIPPGGSLLVRWYLLVGSLENTAKKAAELAKNAGMWVPATDASLLKPVWLADGVPCSRGNGKPELYLHAQPVPGTVPVFTMEDTRTGKIFATMDPYELTRTAPLRNPFPASHPEHARYENRAVHYQYESPGRLRELLGYARKNSLPEGGTAEKTLPGAGSSQLTLWCPVPASRQKSPNEKALP